MMRRLLLIAALCAFAALPARAQSVGGSGGGTAIGSTADSAATDTASAWSVVSLLKGLYAQEATGLNALGIANGTGSAPGYAQAIGGIYRAVPPTLADGAYQAARLSSTGALVMSIDGSSNPSSGGGGGYTSGLQVFEADQQSFSCSVTATTANTALSAAPASCTSTATGAPVVWTGSVSTANGVIDTLGYCSASLVFLNNLPSTSAAFRVSEGSDGATFVNYASGHQETSNAGYTQPATFQWNGISGGITLNYAYSISWSQRYIQIAAYSVNGTAGGMLNVTVTLRKNCQPRGFGPASAAEGSILVNGNIATYSQLPGNPAMQMVDHWGQTWVRTDSRTPTYAWSGPITPIPGLTLALPGNAVTANLVEVVKVRLTCSASSAALVDVNLVQYRTAPGGGTIAGTFNGTPMDTYLYGGTTPETAISSITTYSAPPTVGTPYPIAAQKIFVPADSSPTGPPTVFDWTFGTENTKPLILRSASYVLGLTFNTAPAGLACDATIVWKETLT